MNRFLALLLACAAVALVAPAAALSEWTEVVQYLLSDRCPPVDLAAHPDKFGRDVSALQTAVDNNDFSAAELAPVRGWLVKVRELRQAYGGGGGGKPHAVVVGAGPLGLTTAVWTALKGTHRVTVLEKTRSGGDKRWNAIMAQDEMKTLLTDTLGFSFDRVPPKAETADKASRKTQPGATFPWVGGLPELEYVFAATLKLAGVAVRYDSMYVRACPGAGTAAQTARVWYARAPDDKNLRYKVWGADEVCGVTGGTASALKAAGLAEAGIGHVDSVAVLIGADGTQSTVRRTMLAGTAVTRTADEDKTFPALVGAKPRFEQAGDKVATPSALPLVAKTAVDVPVMTHVIVSLKGTPAEAAKIYDSLPTITPAVVPVATSKLGPLWMEMANRRPTKMEAGQLMASTMPHLVNYVDEAGGFRTRVYLEIMLRHQSSAKFRDIFGAYVGSSAGTVTEMVMRDGSLDYLFAAGSVRSGEIKMTSEEAKLQLATKLLPVLYHLFTSGMGNSAYQRGLVAELGTAEAFNKRLDHVKIFSQSVQGASGVAAKVEGGLLTFLVGDSTRSSYYAHGNSVNSAATALHEHLDDLLDPASYTGRKTGVEARYKRRVVDEFVNFIGGDIYLRTYCGCVQENPINTGHLKRLVASRVSCVAAQPRRATGDDGSLQPNSVKTPRCKTLSFAQTAAGDCGYSKVSKFFGALKKDGVCDATPVA